LADRLETFTSNGVLEPRDGPYLLSEKGRAAFPILITALQWAQHWFGAPEGPAVLLRHTLCDNEFDAVLCCDQCARTLRGADVLSVRP
jgi:hypothetical protein